MRSTEVSIISVGQSSVKVRGVGLKLWGVRGPVEDGAIRKCIQKYYQCEYHRLEI